MDHIVYQLKLEIIVVLGVTHIGFRSRMQGVDRGLWVHSFVGRGVWLTRRVGRRFGG